MNLTRKEARRKLKSNIISVGTHPATVFYGGLFIASVGTSIILHWAAGLVLFGLAAAWDAARPPRGNGP